MIDRPYAVVFDLDGTLVDSWPAHLASLRRACSTVGTVAPSAAWIAARQAATDLQTIRRLVGPDAAGPAIEAYHEALVDYLARRPASPAAGASGVIERLIRYGLRIGVCTGRSRRDAEALLASAGLPVAVVAAREDGARPKPAPDALLHALRVLDVIPGDAVYVGDTEADEVQGRDAGVRTVLVGSTAAGRTGAIASLTDLPTVLQEVMA